MSATAAVKAINVGNVEFDESFLNTISFSRLLNDRDRYCSGASLLPCLA